MPLTFTPQLADFDGGSTTAAPSPRASRGARRIAVALSVSLALLVGAFAAILLWPYEHMKPLPGATLVHVVLSAVALLTLVVAASLVMMVSLLRANQRYDATLAALHDDRERFIAFMDHSPLVAWLKDDAGRMAYINATLERTFAIRRGDVLGKRNAEWLPADVAEVTWQHDQDVLDTGTPHTYIEIVPTPDGTRRQWLVTRFRVIDASGRRWVGGSGLDVTEREEVQAALRQSERRFRSIVETAAEGIWMLDPEGRTTFVNEQMASMLGYSVDEMRGASLYDFMDIEGRRLAERNMQRRREGIAEAHDFRFLRRDGAPLWAIVSTQPLRDEQGAVTGALAMLTDVTERRLLEEQLRQAQKMEAMGRMAGGVAHDFNNLLTIMRATTELLRDNLGGDIADRSAALDDLHTITKAADRAAALTTHLLAFCRRQPMAPRAVDLGTHVVDLVALLGRIRPEGLAVTVDAPPDIGGDTALVYADPTQLEQVVLNLAVNASDAMPSGGTLTLRVAPTVVPEPIVHHHGVIPVGDYVRLEVSDTGTGIPPEVMDHLFEPFFTTKEPGQGTGLGLATVYGIVRQSGGYVAVRPVPEGGACFQVYLPRFEDRRAPGADATARPNLMTEERRDDDRGSARSTPADASADCILVVDDEPDVLRALQRALRRRGFAVATARHGAEALGVVRELGNRLSLIVTDVMMPGMTGPALIEQLARAGMRVPVLFMSGHSAEHVLRADTLTARRRFLRKPFTLSELAELVDELLRLAS